MRDKEAFKALQGFQFKRGRRIRRDAAVEFEPGSKVKLIFVQGLGGITKLHRLLAVVTGFPRKELVCFYKES